MTEILILLSRYVSGFVGFGAGFSHFFRVCTRQQQEGGKAPLWGQPGPGNQQGPQDRDPHTDLPAMGKEKLESISSLRSPGRSLRAGARVRQVDELDDVLARMARNDIEIIL